MAIRMYFGMTESGKSYLAGQHLKKVKRSIIFDYADCYSEGDIFKDFDNETFLKIYRKFYSKENFKIVFKPLGVDIDKRFNKVVHLAIALGKADKAKERLILLTDEADFVCSSSYQSPELKYLVNVGRHDNVDSWFIARTPQRIHTDIRDNASMIICFKLTNDTALGHLAKTIGKKAVDKVRTLEKYFFLAWKDNGECALFNEKSKQLESWS